jgi:predicted  nucleic acid-binding Zn-ribbon protein
VGCERGPNNVGVLPLDGSDQSDQTNKRNNDDNDDTGNNQQITTSPDLKALRDQINDLAVNWRLEADKVKDLKAEVRILKDRFNLLESKLARILNID